MALRSVAGGSSGGGGGGTIPNTTNLLQGDGAGNAADSGIAAANVLVDADIGTTVQAFNANATILGNTTTGSGAIVLATSPTLVTPALGTPSALVGTNITGTAAGLTAGNVTTNANLTGAVTSIGNATSLGAFTSAQLATALTNETGSGLVVFNDSPTLLTPALGTPSALVGTNITGTAAGLNIGGNAATATSATSATTATNATNVATTATTTNASFFPLFVASSSNGNQAASLDTTFTYNPSTDTLTATNFAGNAATATLASTVTTNANLTGAITSSGNATSLGSFTSAQLATALTNETGTGVAVFSISPALVTPDLGTPSAAVLTSATGLPLTSGVTGVLPAANGGVAAGAVLQTLQNQLTATATITSATFAATGLSQAVTPVSSSNKVLIRAMLSVGSAASVANFRITRGGTPIGIGATASNRTLISSAGFGTTVAAMQTICIEWLDSPATTSSTTYAIEWRSYDGANVLLNRTGTDTDSSTFYRAVSTLTVQEIKG